MRHKRALDRITDGSSSWPSLVVGVKTPLGTLGLLRRCHLRPARVAAPCPGQRVRARPTGVASASERAGGRTSRARTRARTRVARTERREEKRKWRERTRWTARARAAEEPARMGWQPGAERGPPSHIGTSPPPRGSGRESGMDGCQGGNSQEDRSLDHAYPHWRHAICRHPPW